MNQYKTWKLVAALAFITLLGYSPARANEGLSTALAGAHRSPANVARDAWRHPRQTLEFFDVQAHMTVVEISPGAGWYTEILAPYLRDKGQLVLAADDPASGVAYYRRSADRLAKRLQAAPALFDRVQVLPFEVPQKIALGPPASADRVLTFRNAHNWAAEGDDAVLAVFKSAFAVLKPGGVMGVVDHRLPASRTQDPKASSGYLQVAYVTRLAGLAGFKLAAVSEVNANPNDTADHPGGVWALPPTYGNKDKDRARFEAIGESDRFTLKFVKP
jgi:predicted methyltransferase